METYREALEDESAEELKEQIREECHYVIEPDLFTDIDLYSNRLGAGDQKQSDTISSLTRIAIAGQEEKRGLSVYDPCIGSGSLLLNAKKYAAEPGYIKYYGQELMTSTYNPARMNMFLHGIVPENQKLRNGDTLPQKLKDQYVFKTEKALSVLRFKEVKFV